MISALFPKTKRKLLALFFLNADREYYFTEVARLTGTRQGAVQRELKTLLSAGLLKGEKRGRQIFYSVNQDSPIFPDLRNIVFKTFGAVNQLRLALEPLIDQIRVAFVYGSFARGEETAKSDIDVFIVGKVSLADVVSALSTAEKQLDREVNPSVYTERELREKYSRRNHFVKSVVESEQTFLIGSVDELRAVVRK
jgi:predicted nucleotidyltransferase